MNKLYVGGGILVALGLALAALVAHERVVGARDAEIENLKAHGLAQDTVIALDAQRLAKIDTVKVFRQVVKSDTVLQHLIDSSIVHHTDTVTVTREVLIEAKAALDSTKKTADACCLLARDYKARWAIADSTVKELMKKVPSAGKPWIDRGEGVLACAGAIWLAGKIAKP